MIGRRVGSCLARAKNDVGAFGERNVTYARVRNRLRTASAPPLRTARNHLHGGLQRLKALASGGRDLSEDQRRPSDVGRGPRVNVAEALRDVARSLEAEPDLQHLVEGIVVAVTETVPGAEAAGVSLWKDKVLRTVAATNDLVTVVNAIEHEFDEGPCMEAVVEERSYRIDDMATDTRWPRFAAAAHAHGVQSMLGYRLFSSGRNLGALDLYSLQPRAFDAQAEVIGELFAAHAAIALIGSTQQADWQIALGSRDLIGMAKGILMHREGITDDRAFALLVTTSRKAGIKVHDLAVWLVEDANETAHTSTD